MVTHSFPYFFCGEALAVSFLHVVVEGNLALVCRVAVRTHLVPPFIVGEAVSLHVVDKAERLAADVTGVWLLPRVYHLGRGRGGETVCGQSGV